MTGPSSQIDKQVPGRATLISPSPFALSRGTSAHHLNPMSLPAAPRGHSRLLSTTGNRITSSHLVAEPFPQATYTTSDPSQDTVRRKLRRLLHPSDNHPPEGHGQSSHRRHVSLPPNHLPGQLPALSAPSKQRGMSDEWSLPIVPSNSLEQSDASSRTSPMQWNQPLCSPRVLAHNAHEMQDISWDAARMLKHGEGWRIRPMHEFDDSVWKESALQHAFSKMMATAKWVREQRSRRRRHQRSSSAQSVPTLHNSGTSPSNSTLQSPLNTPPQPLHRLPSPRIGGQGSNLTPPILVVSMADGEEVILNPPDRYSTEKSHQAHGLTPPARLDQELSNTYLRPPKRAWNSRI